MSRLLRLLEEMAGTRKSRSERHAERVMRRIGLETRRAREAADMVRKIDERLQARDVQHTSNIPQRSAAPDSRRF